MPKDRPRRPAKPPMTHAMHTLNALLCAQANLEHALTLLLDTDETITSTHYAVLKPTTAAIEAAAENVAWLIRSKSHAQTPCTPFTN